MARNTPVPEGYAILKFGGRCLVLPADAAAQAFALLCQGEVVEYQWGDRAYKRVLDPDAAPALQAFSVAQYAQLAMEDPEE